LVSIFGLTNALNKAYICKIKWARPVLTAGGYLCKHVVRCEYGT